MSDRHIREFESFDLVVEVEDEGAVWVSFVSGGDPKVVIPAGDLAEIVAFVQTHGQVTVAYCD